jgi:cytochrome P450
MSVSSTISAPRDGAQDLIASFDLRRLSRGFLDDPYPTYRALRESSPIHRLPDGSYFLTRYDDLVAVYRDAKTWSSDKKIDFKPNFGDSLLYEHHTTSLVFNDPPIHTRVRKLLAPTFTPRALAALQPRIEALVDRLLDLAMERGSIDLIEEFAAAIPVQLIGDLLGIPQDERAPLRQWSLDILGALEPVLPREKFEAGAASVSGFKDYLRSLVARRKGQGPGEGCGDDAEILSKLIAGSDLVDHAGIGSERLSENELLHNCIFLLNAGHETTTNLIGNAVDLLLRFPGEFARLKAQPGLIETAVEEFLRMESSNQLGNRRAAVDTELGGIAMPAGTYVHLGIGAANRDPAQFSDPERLDVGRKPNRHLAFGFGIHTCAGNSLARMETQVAIGKLVARFTAIEPAGEPVRGGRARFRGFQSYPLRVR